MEDQHREAQPQGKEVNQPQPPAAPTMAELLEQSDFEMKAFQRGEVVEGEIVRITDTEILIDIGAKSEGVVPQRDLERLDKEYVESLKPGMSVLAVVVRPHTPDGHIIVSLTRAQMEQDWREAEALFKNREVFEGVVAGHNKGGLIVRMGRLRGFVPASQLVSEHRRDSADGEPGWAKMVGETLQLKVIEIDRRRNRLILSERAAMREWREEQKEQLLESLREGEVRRGTVTSLCDFGAFVDLGGADGLIHISELSWGRVNHPGEVLRQGQQVDVYVLNVDRERKRIGLSLKRLEPEPWDLVEEKYRVGQLVEGEITKLMPFGAFARIDNEIEGLIHISELAEERINHPKEVVKEGEVHTLRIIRIDPQKRRMGLSLKRVADPQYADIDWREEYAASFEEDEDWDEMEEYAEVEEQAAPSEAVTDEQIEVCLADQPEEEEVSVSEESDETQA